MIWGLMKMPAAAARITLYCRLRLNEDQNGNGQYDEGGPAVISVLIKVTNVKQGQVSSGCYVIRFILVIFDRY